MYGAQAIHVSATSHLQVDLICKFIEHGLLELLVLAELVLHSVKLHGMLAPFIFPLADP